MSRPRRLLGTALVSIGLLVVTVGCASNGASTESGAVENATGPADTGSTTADDGAANSESTSGVTIENPESTAGTETAAPDEKLNIWYVNPLVSYPAFKMSSDLFEEYGKVNGVETTVVGPSKIDIPAMITGIDQAIADNANGIITCDLDPKAFAAGIAKAQAAGVVVVTIGCVDEISDFSIGTDNKLFGRDAADAIAKGAGEDAQVGIITSDNSTPNQVEQVDAFKARLSEKHPDVKIVAWEYDNSDTATAASKIGAMMQANPTINALWCVDGNCPGGVEAGLTAAGKAAGTVYALGIDAVDNTVAAIESGWISATLNQCYFIASPLAVELIRAKVAGQEVAERSYGIPADPISITDLPYKGCPSDVVPDMK